MHCGVSGPQRCKQCIIADFCDVKRHCLNLSLVEPSAKPAKPNVTRGQGEDLTDTSELRLLRQVSTTKGCCWTARQWSLPITLCSFWRDSDLEDSFRAWFSRWSRVSPFGSIWHYGKWARINDKCVNPPSADNGLMLQTSVKFLYVRTASLCHCSAVTTSLSAVEVKSQVVHTSLECQNWEHHATGSIPGQSVEVQICPVIIVCL